MAITNFNYCTATGQLTRQWQHHYTYYYSWLQQHENIISDYHTDSGQHLLLTAKRLRIETKSWKRDLPLQKIKRLSLQFKRLTFPLIVGAIVGSFAALATYKGILSYWMGASLAIKGNPIKGLYAAGEALGAAATSGNAFCGGMLITPALSFGRILGRKLGQKF
jgi:hypothetical protein